MNPLAKPFNPKSTEALSIRTDLLSTTDAKIFHKLCSEWANIPTLDCLLDNWMKRSLMTLTLLKKKQDISLLLLNVASLNLYLLDVINLINNVCAPIVILNGTHHDEATVKLFASQLFNLNIFSNKGTNAFGGVLIGVHKSIRTTQVSQFANIDNLIVLEIASASQPFQLVTCYSPPTEQLPLTIFDQILRRNTNTIFAGDLNAKHSSWSKSSENQKGRALFTWLSTDHYASSHVIVNRSVPTSTRSNATIDIFIVPAHMSSDSFAVLPSMGSDHFPVIWHPNFKISSHHHQQPIKRTRWRLLEVFLTYTASFWNKLATTMLDKSAYFTLYERFLSLCVSRLTFVSFQHSYRPSLPPHLVDLLDQKRNVLQCFRRSRHPIFAVILRDLSKQARHCLFEHKRTSWVNYCKTLNECDVLSFWRKAKRHFNSRAPPIEGFIINDKTISSPADMCDSARTHYEEQFAAHPHSNTPIESEADQSEIELQAELTSASPLRILITYPMIIKALASLKNKASSGVDGVSNRVIKLLPKSHLPIIFCCFNSFAKSSRTPPHWHTAKMILLSKTKSKAVSLEETRPISLLPCFSKLYEKCFLSQIRSWIKDRGILPDEQSGFRPGHNMAVRIAAIIDQIGRSLSMNTAAAGLFIDYKSAFNQLWFQGLWLKLKRLECPLNLIAWLRHYLTGRSAYIDINGSCSAQFPLLKGVPQGSCVGPVLFILYHHDMLDSISPVHWKHLFADDLSVVFAPSPTLAAANMMLTLADQIKEVLQQLLQYSIMWKQDINFKKTFWILFHRQVAPRIPDITVDGRRIDHVKRFKYLGTILDAKLSFIPHINQVRTKIKTNLNIFKRIASTRMMSESVRYRLFNAYIRPHFQSLLTIFPALSPHKQNQIEALNRQIHRATNQWYDARNIEIEALERYQSIAKLTGNHWQKLAVTILRTNPGVVEDFLQHKQSILYLQDYLTNPSLTKERRSIFGRGRIRKNLTKLITNGSQSLLDYALGYTPVTS